MKKNIHRKLKYISPREIRPNPENPRIIFRQEEVESLLISIDKYGIQVPITVYHDKNYYFLIDGERRWRCAHKLNLKEIPAIVQTKPTSLENLLLMSNIHALREQWDFFTIAMNLKKIIYLLKKRDEVEPNERLLISESGLTQGQIRRCKLLLELPTRFQQMLLKELHLPKSHQRLSEDFFLEMESALRTVCKRLPHFRNQLDKIRDVMIEKYRSKTIENILDFRQLAKIATAIKNIGIKEQKAEKALLQLFERGNKVSIRQVYVETVEFGYDERKAEQYIDHLNEYFKAIFKDKEIEKLDEHFLGKLERLSAFIKQVLGA